MIRIESILGFIHVLSCSQELFFRFVAAHDGDFGAEYSLIFRIVFASGAVLIQTMTQILAQIRLLFRIFICRLWALLEWVDAVV